MPNKKEVFPTESMRKFANIIFTIFVVFIYGVARSQDDVDLYRKTLSFLKLLTYGERNEDVGLCFSWQQVEGQWVPKGNGFKFLSEGLGVYDYETADNFHIPDESLWHVDRNLCPAIISDSIFQKTDIVTFTSGSDTESNKNDSTALYIELKPLVNYNDSIIPARIIKSHDDNVSPSKLDFIAYLDRNEELLILRFLNLLPHEVQAYIDNSPYPASRLGICSQSIIQEPGCKTKPAVSTIDMKGEITLPPFSFTLFKFAIRPEKYKKS